MCLKLVFRRKFNFISRFFCYAPDLVMFQNAWVLLTGRICARLVTDVFLTLKVKMLFL